MTHYHLLGYHLSAVVADVAAVVVFRSPQTFSGVLWTLAMANSTGFWRRHSGDVLAACDFEVLAADACCLFLALLFTGQEVVKSHGSGRTRRTRPDPSRDI